ncbi:bifunctional 3-dehydroquinate dehydratase/shikimate dehydrogenase, chloroplastic [Haematococcus lacustris]|uniref:Bifunctional 3-dehydroquinate dehydratase/shikimate dehydrogenase, chloroplastic n=1 Tax=Haematococcus lacustris TaxID=44745 RepID=A0A699Z3Z2_HAELA|nr:bifunctional 3-dehydroquinate dehydratase/shikimate dehydrogenase, chloroplastic [Haematococcus lacustris]
MLRHRHRSLGAAHSCHLVPPAALPKSSICVSVTATTVESFIHEIEEVERAGADIVELRLDYIKDFDTERDLARIMASCSRPYIVTFRPQRGEVLGAEA